MRFSYVYMCLIGLFAACTPITPPKAANNGSCRTNSDCSSGVCKENKCINRVDCNLIENIDEPFCTGRPCNAPSDCPNNFSCVEGLCVAAGAGGCTSDEGCVGNDEGEFCLVQSETDPTENQCVACLKAEDCPKNNDCDKNTYKCVEKKPMTGCKKNSECLSTPDTPLCKISTGKCVECRERVDCESKPNTTCTADGKCVDTSAKDCTMPEVGCPINTQPLCDPATKTCVPCTDMPAGVECPELTECKTSGPSMGQCLPPGTGDSYCENNADCRNTSQVPPGKLDGVLYGGTAVPAAAAAQDASLWCDATGVTPPYLGEAKGCKPCRTGAGVNDCGAGHECQALGGVNVCVPSQGGSCTSPEQCQVGEACTGGSCSTTCNGNGSVNTCKAPKVCAPGSANSTCVDPVSCDTPGPVSDDQAVCAAQAPGFACFGTPRVCQPCGAPSDCAQYPDGRTDCQNGRCVAPSTGQGLALGARTSSAAECESGAAFDFGDGFVCTQVCTHTESTSMDENDCPTSVDAAVRADRGLPAGAGFACLNANTGTALDGIGLCATTKDFLAWSGATPLPGNAFTLAGGVAVPANPLSCQSTLPGDGGVCAWACGSTQDCVDQIGDGWTCREVITNQLGSGIGSGKRICRQPPPTAKAPGAACKVAEDCSEGFCNGRVIARFVKRFPEQQCTTSPQCQNSESCIDGSCHTPTERTNPSSCGPTSPCNGSDVCIDAGQGGTCFAAQALTNRWCQDTNSAQHPGREFCAGTCAKHCNSQADCGDAGLKPGAVCNYRPAAPGYNQNGDPPFNDGEFVGQSWTRICLNKAPILPPQDPLLDHTTPIGGSCSGDTECVSEVCGKGPNGNRCTNYCGGDGTCPMGQFCAVELKHVDPNNTMSFKIYRPVCRAY